MDTRLSIYAYEGSEVTFSNGDNVMVNATQMAKAFGTKPANWLRTEQAQRMIEAIAVSQKCDSADLVVVTRFFRRKPICFSNGMNPSI